MTSGENPAAPTASPSWALLRKLALPAAFVLAVAAQTALFLYNEPLEVVFSARPLSGRDYDTHLGQVWRVTEALDGWGKSWAYDVQLLAGYPNGTIFDADNKGWELWTYALYKLGLPMGTAFNMFLLLAHLLETIYRFHYLQLIVYPQLQKWHHRVSSFLYTLGLRLILSH